MFDFENHLSEFMWSEPCEILNSHFQVVQFHLLFSVYILGFSNSDRKFTKTGCSKALGKIQMLKVRS